MAKFEGKKPGCSGLISDDCAYKQRLHESTSPLSYQLDPNKFYSCNRQLLPVNAMYLGLMGRDGYGVGPARVDVDSDLRGQTRLLSKCPSQSYNPYTYTHCNKNLKGGEPCGSTALPGTATGFPGSVKGIPGEFCMNCRRLPDVPTKVKGLCHQEDSVENFEVGSQECLPGLVPMEAQDTRQFGPCRDTNGLFINRFDFLCQNPQEEDRVIFYKNNRRLGEETRLDMKDNYPHGVRPGEYTDCLYVDHKEKSECMAGGLGCRKLGDFSKNIYI